MTAVKDIDAFSHLDPATGTPLCDNQSPARRWMDALDVGPAQTINNVTTLMKTNPTTTAGDTATPHTTQTKTMPQVVPPDQVDLELMEQLLTDLGYRCNWPEPDMLAAETDTHHLVVHIIEHIPIILIAGWVDLAEDLPPQDALRFANRLNDTIWGARFKLMEPSSEDLQCSPNLPPDNNPLWVEVELHYGAGLVLTQVAKSTAILAKAVEEAIDIGIEQGVVDDADEWSPHWSTKSH